MSSSDSLSTNGTPIPASISGSSSPNPQKLFNINPANIISTTRDEKLDSVSSSDGPVPRTKICVFCGASPGNSPAHMEGARALARVFHENNISLVYGGGTVGLMGEVARTLVSLSGPDSVHGIIPAPLIKYERGPDSKPSEISSSALPEFSQYGHTTVVLDMHTRKQLFAAEVLLGGPGSGFIALSGGYGTLEELMEVITWNQLGIHNRGIVALNIEGYWDGLLAWANGAVEAGFVGEGNRSIFLEAKNPEEAVHMLSGYRNAEGRFKLSWGCE
ncbi:related to Rossmann fold nucleotide-binding protein [Rhynchosporium secalis]|uniref:Related to Rossmann fold nucleotide-binding protein n=1 Tax=Rhynchosporium secalis TaxID=38038 RepID=A0A1E1MN18_RHYSE|nr:related to Rossmann fold nucleotide-binding protein [Rhynchosporium secalis]